MRQVELNQAWQQGNYYPRWGTDLAFGHGMPIFNYAPPALYQATQLFHTLGLPLAAAMKAVLVVVFFLYSVGMFLFARRIYGAYPALVAAAVYVYAPYRLREAYIQGNYGQFIGLACYPLIFWAFHGLITDGRPRYLIAAVLSLAALLLSHNISAMLFAPIFAIYLTFLLSLTTLQKVRSQKNTNPEPSPTHDPSPPITPHAPRTTHYPPYLQPLAQTITAAFLGLALSAIFWLPAFGERHDIKLEGITQGFFDFRQNFISIPEFFAPPLPLDLSAINPEFPLSLGLPQIIGAGLGIIALLFALSRRFQPPPNVQISKPPAQDIQSSNPSISRSPVNNPTLLISQLPIPHTLFFIVALLLYTFLATPPSQPFWETIPLLELAEFPWRMLGPAIFCASVLSAAAFPLLNQLTHYALRTTSHVLRKTQHPTPNTQYTLNRVTLLFSWLLIIVLNAYYLYPSQFIRWGTPSPADAFEYEIISGAIGTTSTGEFLPRGAQQHPLPDTLWPNYQAGVWPQKIDPSTVPPGTVVEAIDHLAELDAWRVAGPEEFVATIRTLAWPGWQLYLDDQPLPFATTPHTGLIQATIPPGDHTLTLHLGSTPLRTTGTWLTILSATILLVLTVVAFYRNYTHPSPSPHSSLLTPHPSPSSLTFFLSSTLLLLGFYIISRPLAPLFVLQSDPNRPQPAEQQVQVDFADQLRLVGFSELPELVEQGDTLSLTLFWRVRQELETNYSVFVHLDAPNGQTFATIDEVHPENIPTRNWPPGLYLRNPFHLDLPADIPPIRYEVRLGVYHTETGERLAILPDQTTTYKLGTLWVVEAEPPIAAGTVAHFGSTVTLHQAEFDGQAVRLTWQTAQSLPPDHTIFVHLLDNQGNLLGQLDGWPYDGLYPLEAWRPNQPINDVRLLNPPQPALSRISVGIYNTITGHRLPATDADGNPLPHNAFTLTVFP